MFQIRCKYFFKTDRLALPGRRAGPEKERRRSDFGFSRSKVHGSGFRVTCFALRVPGCGLCVTRCVVQTGQSAIPNRIPLSSVICVPRRSRQAKTGSLTPPMRLHEVKKANRRTAEYPTAEYRRMESLRSVLFIKLIEYLTSTFDIHNSIFAF